MVHFGGDRLSMDGCDDETQFIGTRVSPHFETGQIIVDLAGVKSSNP
jgi:hypothetical protein